MVGLTKIKYLWPNATKPCHGALLLCDARGLAYVPRSRTSEQRASCSWVVHKKIDAKNPCCRIPMEGYGGPRDEISLSLICSTYLANSSSFAFFASSAASTGGKVGEKGTGLFGPFLRPRR